jgi:hypothetical protein
MLAPSAVVGDRLLSFAVNLLLGGAAIAVGARVLGDGRGYAHAVLTALVGALAWAVFDSVPLLGGLLALVAWTAVINWQYRGGWVRAAAIGVAAWAAAVLARAALRLAGVGGLSALGVPGA